MTVTSVVKDADARTMTITARFDAPIGRVWRVWSDPRQLERWWGPPMYPATVTEHDLTPGGTVAYTMTGPEGDRHRGWWRVRAVDPPHTLEFEDGFADADGNEPGHAHRGDSRRPFRAGRRRHTVDLTTAWASVEAMEQILAVGTEAG
jgi:uncharacterized protein YndB with AHSA1/START domain